MNVTDKTATNCNSLRYRLYEILEISAVDDRVSQLVDRFMVGLIVANVIAVILETIPTIAASYGALFHGFELVSIIVFSVEYVVRLWVCVERSHKATASAFKGRLTYLVSPLAIADLVAILPFFLSFLGADLRFLRLLRLFRLLKLVRYSPALVTLGRVLQNERRALFAAVVVIVSLVILSGSVMYYLERGAQPENFGHIPLAMWWAITTLTTVGYGDVVPITDAGRLFGGFVMLFGLGMYALPIGIIATGFANEIGQRDFVITWHALVRVPIFARLDSEEIAQIVDLLKAQIAVPGQTIARMGDQAEDMFFILSGDVQVRTRHHQYTLGPGEYFGEIALLTGNKRFGSATALTRCHLMRLSRVDFEHLMLDNAQMRRAIVQEIRAGIDRGTAIGREISSRDVEDIERSLFEYEQAI
jgi:voltage-gated potassium channel